MAHVFVKGLGIRYELPTTEPEVHIHEYLADNDYQCICGASL